MHGPINVKSHNNNNNNSKWQMGFNSAFKGLTESDIYKIGKTDTNELKRLH
jgi:hypothetical protein